MAQIKYVVFGCLIFAIGWFALTGLQKIYPAQSSAQFTDPVVAVQQKRVVSIGPEVLNGQELFRENCQACHAINKVCGYPMNNVISRDLWAENKNNIKSFIRDPKTFIPTTQYTRDLYKQFGQVMPSFHQLTNEDLEALYQFLVYLNDSRT